MVDKSQKFITLVRLGYAARGITYVLLGWIALQAAQLSRTQPSTQHAHERSSQRTSCRCLYTCNSATNSK